MTSLPATHTFGYSTKGPELREEADVAVVIPAFNEEEGVGATVERVQAVLAEAGCTAEVLVVDDASTDGTAELADAAGARVLRLPEHQGYGAALKAGIAASATEYVVILDADGTYPAEAIPDLLAQALLLDADMVVGARPANSANIPLARRPAKWFLNALASYLAGRTIPDVNSGLRVMRRSLVRRFLPLLPSGFSFTTTITLASLCTQHRVVYVPIEYRPRLGRSKIRPTHFTSFLLLVLRLAVLFNPLKVFLPLGAALFLAGLAKGTQDALRWDLSQTAVLCFLSAITVWSFGLLADMIARLHLYGPEIIAPRREAR